MTKTPSSSSRTRPPAATGAERQQRHRKAKGISSLGAEPAVMQQMAALRAQTGLSNNQILLRALALFAAQQSAPAEPARRGTAASPTPTAPPAPAVTAKPTAKKSSRYNESTPSAQGAFDLLLDPVAWPDTPRRQR